MIVLQEMPSAHPLIYPPTQQPPAQLKTVRENDDWKSFIKMEIKNRSLKPGTPTPLALK